MTFPVSIEYGNHSLAAELHALPRAGDHITCAFPRSGIPKLFLKVKGLHFHQPSDSGEVESAAPFVIVITTDDDPDFLFQNREVFERLGKSK